MTLTEEIAYCQGYIDALFTFAWMKDGKTFVGTTGHLYNKELERLQLRFPNVDFRKMVPIIGGK